MGKGCCLENKEWKKAKNNSFAVFWGIKLKFSIADVLYKK